MKPSPNLSLTKGARSPSATIGMAWLCLALALSASRAVAAGLQPREGDFVITNFQFQTGEALPELRLHYRTLGTPRTNAHGLVTNAVLALHGTSGSGGSLMADSFAGVLFGPGGLLDAARYFIILPDGIGHGQSSKPSDGLRMRFPRYTYDDMVRAQHALLTDGLGVNHLRLVIGTSMGGMHTWVWGEMYPDFMDALMPLASAPVEIAGRNRIWRKMILDAIRGDPGWDNGNYTVQPRSLTNAADIMILLGSAPLQMHKQAPTRQTAEQLLDERRQRILQHADANDWLYAFDASRNYNPAPRLADIRAPLVAVNSADDEINPPELGILEREIQRVPHGRFVLLPISDATRGHGTHTFAAVWQEYLKQLLQQAPPPE